MDRRAPAACAGTLNALLAVFALIAIGTRLGWPLPVLVGLLVLAHVALIGCWRERYSKRRLLACAALAGLIAMAAHPVAEDDFYRYQWDGWRTLSHGTPYGAAPAEFFGDESLPPAAQAALDGVNYPDTPTIYGPLLQALFATSWLLGENSLWPLRFLVLVLHLIALWQAMRYAPRRALALVALNPALFFFGFVNLHPDILLGWLLFFAIIAVRTSRVATAGALLGAAVATKISGLIVAPLLFATVGMGNALRAASTMLALLALCYAPFLALGDAAGLLAFGTQWTFNPGGFALLAGAFGSDAARPIAVALVLAFAAALALCAKRRYLARHAAALLIALLLLSPVVNAWYALWFLPLAALTRAATPWAMCAALSMTLLTHGELGREGDPFALLPWVAWVQWTTIALALAVDLVGWRQLRAGWPVLSPGRAAR